MDLCEKFCKPIREAAGSKADPLLGTHGQFTTTSCHLFRPAHRRKTGTAWFEEPTPPEKPEEMALAARGTKIPAGRDRRASGHEI